MTDHAPQISIVIAVFNGALTLKRCLDSVTQQSYAAKQLIVMDGGSQDGTVEILRQYGDRIDYWESEQDRGIYHAWNKALAKATGDWICFLGSDDYFWSNDTLDCLGPYLVKAYPEKRIAYGRIAVMDPDGTFLRYEGQDWDTSAQTFTRAMNLPHPGMMHHRSIFEELGGFDESLRICADYDLLLRELPARPACFIADLVTLGVQHGGVSYSPAAMGTMLRELDYIRRKHGLRTPGLWDSPSVLWKMRLCAFTTRIIGENGSQRLAGLFRRSDTRQSHQAALLERQGGV